MASTSRFGTPIGRLGDPPAVYKNASPEHGGIVWSRRYGSSEEPLYGVPEDSACEGSEQDAELSGDSTDCEYGDRELRELCTVVEQYAGARAAAHSCICSARKPPCDATRPLEQAVSIEEQGPCMPSTNERRPAATEQVAAVAE